MIGIWLIWEKPNICNKSNISSTIHTGLNNFHISLWSTTINTSQPKLRTYCRFKTDFALENYIQLFKRSTRLNFTKSASPQCKVARARPTEGLVFFSLSSKQTPIQARSQGCGMRRTPPLNLSKGLLLATKAHKVDKMFCFCFCFCFCFFFARGLRGEVQKVHSLGPRKLLSAEHFGHCDTVFTRQYSSPVRGVLNLSRDSMEKSNPFFSFYSETANKIRYIYFDCNYLISFLNIFHTGTGSIYLKKRRALMSGVYEHDESVIF